MRFKAFHKKEAKILSWLDLIQTAWNTYIGEDRTSLLYSILVARKDEFEVLRYSGLKTSEEAQIYAGDILHYKGKDYIVIDDEWRFRLSRNMFYHGENINIALDEDVAWLSLHMGSMYLRPDFINNNE